MVLDTIYRGTTPLLTITLPSDITAAGLTAAYLTISQGDLVIEKTITDMSIEGTNKIAYQLSQAETLQLNAGKNGEEAFYQLRLKDANGVYATKWYRLQVGPIIKEGLI